MKLKINALKGVIYSSISIFTNQFFNFLSKIILAWFLMPEDFGIIAIILSIGTLVTILFNLGWCDFLIIKKEQSNDAFNTIFTFFFIMGLGLSSILFLSSKFIAGYYSTESLTPLLQTYSLTIIFYPIHVIYITYLQKQLSFFKKNVCEVISSLSFFTLAIILAYFNFGVRSIILAQIAQSILLTILLFSVTKNYYPKFTFNSIHFIEAFSFVKESAWGYISAIVILYIDNLFVGKYFGLDAAGYYAMAFSLAGVVNIIITTPISGVLFPIINSQEPTQRSSTVKKAINLNYSILLPIVLFIIIFAKSFLLYGLSEKWLPALGLFRIFLIYVIFRSFCNLSATTALSIGKPNIFRKVLLIELIILCILIYPSAFFFHIEGVAIAALFSRFISAALFHYYLSQDLEITLPYYLNRAYILGLSSGISLMIVWILKERFLESLLFYQLSILFFVYVLCYSIINLFIDNVNRKEVYAMFDDIKISKPL